MQAPTHLLTGIIIQKVFKRRVTPHLQYFLVALFSLFSHGVLDGLTRFTYHPTMPLLKDGFWVSYHVIIAFLTIFIFVKFWKEYKIGLIFSILPDFDFIILHFCGFFQCRIPFWSEPLLHKIFFGFVNHLFPLNFLNLPDWSLEREGATLEFALLITLVTFIYAIRTGKAEKFTPTTAKRKKPSFTSDWINKLSIYIDCMDHEQSIRTAYQSLLTSLEVALLSLFLFSLELNLTDYLWIFFVLGMILCPTFATACEYHARNVDSWRMHIVELVRRTDVEEAFEDGKYRWIPFGKKGSKAEYYFGHWFERILVFIMLIIWWLIGLQFFLRPLTVAFAILVTLCWGAYVFRLIEPKGEIVHHLHRKIIL